MILIKIPSFYKRRIVQKTRLVGNRLSNQIKLFLLCSLVSFQVNSEISGRVIDLETQQNLSDVRVSIQASDIEVLSNTQGEFLLPNGGVGMLTVVGAKHGFYNGSITTSNNQSGITIQLEAVPFDNVAEYQFLNPNECGACHPDQLAEWSNSPMSKGGTNSWVYDIYDGTGTENGTGGFVYVNDSVHAISNPESECASCHQPESWINEPFSALKPLDNGDASTIHGVSCEVCHKAANIDAAKPNFPGMHPETVTMNLPDFGDFDIQYGVLGDTDFKLSGAMKPAYQPQLTAELCGACHQDKNDHDGDGDFEDPGGVISEPTYIEWLESDYGNPESPNYTSCVDCHMPSTGANAACELLPNMQRPPTDVRSHDIRGTTTEYLTNAVSLSLAAEFENGEIQVEVNINNDKTGHHVPSGVTIRNMILLVEATYSDGTKANYLGDQFVHELGGVGNPEEGYYAGLPGKLYGKINHDSSGTGPTFFSDATGILSDNRIPANEVDTTQYSFEVAQEGNIRVAAKLIYRRSWRFLTDAKQWKFDGHGNPLEDVMAPHFGYLMENEELVVNTDPEPESEPSVPTTTSKSSGGFDLIFLLYLAFLVLLRSNWTRCKTLDR